VRAGPIGAVVGELPRVPRPTRGALERYDAAIRQLHARRRAVLPARYGSCFAGPDEVAFVLRSRQASLRAALAHVRGRAQMTVRVLPRASRQDAAGAVPARIVNPRSRVRTTTGRDARYLQERAARTSGLAGFVPVREAVRRWERDEQAQTSGR